MPRPWSRRPGGPLMGGGRAAPGAHGVSAPCFHEGEGWEANTLTINIRVLPSASPRSCHAAAGRRAHFPPARRVRAGAVPVGSRRAKYWAPPTTRGHLGAAIKVVRRLGLGLGLAVVLVLLLAVGAALVTVAISTVIIVVGPRSFVPSHGRRAVVVCARRRSLGRVSSVRTLLAGPGVCAVVGHAGRRCPRQRGVPRVVGGGAEAGRTPGQVGLAGDVAAGGAKQRGRRRAPPMSRGAARRSVASSRRVPQWRIDESRPERRLCHSLLPSSGPAANRGFGSVLMGRFQRGRQRYAVWPGEGRSR